MSPNVKFQPPGPFGLPDAQSAIALPLSGIVEVRLRAFVADRPETIVFRITPDAAEALAVELQSAAIAARKAK
jgi:hypothetical protein